jgi:hypothetical protein
MAPSRSTSSATQAAQVAIRNGFDPGPPLYAPMRTCLHALIIASRGFFRRLIMCIGVDLLVSSGDIAQIAQAIRQGHDTQDSVQVGISAWSLLLHTLRIGTLFLFFHIEDRQRQTVDETSLSQSLDLDPPELQLPEDLESGLFEIGSLPPVRVPALPVHCKPHHVTTSYVATTQSPKHAYTLASHTLSSSDALHVARNSTASSAPLGQGQMRTFHSHTPLSGKLIRPPPVLTRQHLSSMQSKVNNHNSASKSTSTMPSHR